MYISFAALYGCAMCSIAVELPVAKEMILTIQQVWHAVMHAHIGFKVLLIMQCGKRIHC